MRLNKSQRELVLAWLAAGLQSDEINQLAAQQHPPFSVARSTLTHYRKTRETRLEEIRRAGEDRAMVDGYASAEFRVRKLAMLAALLEQDLLNGQPGSIPIPPVGTPEEDDVDADELPQTSAQAPTRTNKLWLRQVKGIGRGENFERVEHFEFNASELQQYRGLLEDIAKEMGQRTTKIEMDQETTIIWDLPVPGWEPPQPPDASSD